MPQVDEFEESEDEGAEGGQGAMSRVDPIVHANNRGVYLHGHALPGTVVVRAPCVPPKDGHLTQPVCAPRQCTPGVCTPRTAAFSYAPCAVSRLRTRSLTHAPTCFSPAPTTRC